MSFDRPTAADLRKALERRGLPVRQERLSFVRSSALPDVEILVALDSFHPWRIYNRTYALCACRTAATDWRYRGGLHSLQDGSTMLLQPGEAHANTVVHKYSDFKALFIEPAQVRQAACELGSAGDRHRTAREQAARGRSHRVGHGPRLDERCRHGHVCVHKDGGGGAAQGQ